MKNLADVIAYTVFVFLLATAPAATCQTASTAPDDINVELMETTFKIQGPDKADARKSTIGTVFFIGRPMLGAPTKAMPVLVTAAHVLDGIGGDEATLFVRRKTATGALEKYPLTLHIRSNGRNRYVRHPTADVAAMYVDPQDLNLVAVAALSILADDDTFTRLEIHPGDELECLGYPLGAEANDLGYPILRSGKIASYPLVPASVVKQYLFDFEVFPGNSGGPVYFSYSTRFMHGHAKVGHEERIVGLITEQAFSPFPELADRPLEIGVVVPAQFIAETINMLPQPIIPGR